MSSVSVKSAPWPPRVAETLEGISVLFLVKVKRDGWKVKRVFLEGELIEDFVCKLWEEYGIENVKVERLDIEQPPLPGM